jgi:pimeloyl-ACP methyl ester carboxylesterase
VASDAVIGTPFGSLAVRDYGGSGPPVLLLHGLGHNLEVWRKVTQLIGDRARVVAVDLRGHGKSTYDTPFTLADLADDVTRVCAATSLDHPVLVGHSLGGWAALAAAAGGLPTRSLITVEGPVMSMETLFRGLGMTPDGGAGGADLLESTAFRGDDAAWNKRLDRAGPPGSIARAVAARGMHRGDDGLWWALPLPATLVAAQRCIWQIDPAVAYLEVDTPVTLLLGEKSAQIPNSESFREIRHQALAPLLANQRLEVRWAAGGHHLPVECPWDVADAIRAAAAR